MRNKKLILTLSFIAITVLIIIWNHLFSTSSTTAVVTVLEKSHSEDNGEAYVIVLPPNMPKEYREEAKTKIVVKEPMVWNLIVKDEEYFIHYSSKPSGVNVLTHIEYLDDNNAIPQQ